MTDEGQKTTSDSQIDGPVPTVDGLFPGVPELAYHHDQGSLSSSGAKLLATAPPAVFRDRQLNGWAPKKEFDTGSLVHRIVLGEGPQIAAVDAEDWRTKAAREARGEAREAGMIPALMRDVAVAERIADQVFDHPIASDLFSAGEAEVSAYGTDPVTGVRMRGRVDWLRDDYLVDLKTSADPSEAGFARSIWKFGYCLQAWWYLTLARQAGHAAQDFVFVVVGTKAPYLVTTYRLSERYLEYGAGMARRALDAYVDCQVSGEWPGYPARINLVDLPAWAATESPDDVEAA